MRYILWGIALVLTGSSYASGISTRTSDSPESCAEFLQLLHGNDERPSGSYSLALEKGKDIISKKGRVPTYHLRVDGIPKGRKFQVAHRNAFGSTVIVFEGVYLGEGKMLSKFDGASSFVPIVSREFQIGEPSEFLLIDPKNSSTDSIFYLPYPAEPAVMDNLKVCPYLVSPFAYLFEMKNLIPGERVNVKASIESEVTESSFIASESGMATSFIRSNSDELPDSELSFEIKRKSGTLLIQFPWIRESSKLPNPLVILTVNHKPTQDEIECATTAYLEVSQ